MMLVTAAPAPAAAGTHAPVAAMKGAPKDWMCLECGKKMNLRAAKKAMTLAGCPKCGGSDIDMAPLGA
jgi:NAD-dependent SIR2 family protein deacetylase